MPVAVEKCVARIKPAVRKQYPNKTDSEIESIAWGTCTNMYKSGKLNRDGTEREEIIPI